MMLYRYTTLDHQGQKRKGQIFARDSKQALSLLSSNGDLVVDLEEAAKRNWFKLERSLTITPRRASEFSIELAGLLSAGASLRKALDIQAEGRHDIAKFARAVRRDIDAGRTFSTALRSAGGAAETLAEFASAGEAGAGLDEIMEAAGRFLSARDEAIGKIKNALAYPLFVLLLAFLALLILTLYVAPALAPAIEETGKQGIIAFLSDASFFLKSNSTPILIGIAAFASLIVVVSRRADFQKSINKTIWKMPILGAIARDLDTGQSCSVLSALLQSGKSLESSLHFAAAVSGPELSDSYHSISVSIRDGQTASAAFLSESALPREVRRLALLGEQTSTLGKAIGQAGRICHERAMRRIDAISRVVGPALVIGLGVAVSLLMISVLGSLSTIGEIT